MKTELFSFSVTFTVHYGYSVAIECKSVVYSLLSCIMGLNECTSITSTIVSDHIVPYLRVQGGDFGHSLSLAVFTNERMSLIRCVR